MKKTRNLALRDVQLAELELLRKFTRFCDEYHLKYFLYGGTLLGAVRHNGFIPWDDDIDIIMPRPDYDRLLEYNKKGYFNFKNIELALPEEIYEPDFLIGKLYDRTIRLDAENPFNGTYLWIDIMPVDGMPEKNRTEFLAKMNKMRKLYFLMRHDRKIIMQNKNFDEFDNWKIRLAARVTRGINYDKYVKKHVLAKAKTYDYNASIYVCDTVWAKHPGNILKKEWLDKTIRMKFENTEFNVFGGYKYYLENRYGKDYMKLPPKEQRITHGIKAYRVDKNK